MRPRVAGLQIARIGAALAVPLALSSAYPASAAAPPLKALREVEAYLERNYETLREKLEQYNRDHIKITSRDNRWFIGT